jgi:hypothetical protein
VIGRDDVTVKATTLTVNVEVPPARITSTHHAWVTWAELAIQHEAFARDAHEAKDVYEFRPGLVALTSAAFALDALYGVAKHLIPDPGTKGHRGAIVAERLKRGVTPGKLAAKWPQRIRDLFDERHAAVHFGEEVSDLEWHSGLSSNVDPHVLRWGADAAMQSVDLLPEVFAAWADHPSKLIREWSTSYKPSVRALEELRGSN